MTSVVTKQLLVHTPYSNPGAIGTWIKSYIRKCVQCIVTKAQLPKICPDIKNTRILGLHIVNTF